MRASPEASGLVGETGSHLGDHLIGTAINTGQSAGLDALQNAVSNPTSDGSEWQSGAQTDMKQMMGRNLMNTYIRTGLIDHVPDDLLVKDAQGHPVGLRPDMYSAADAANNPNLSPHDRQELSKLWSSMASKQDYIAADGASVLSKLNLDDVAREAANDASTHANQSWSDRQRWEHHVGN